MHRNRIRDLLAMPPGDRAFTAAGWVRTRRDSKGGFSFLELNDGSCFANLQVVADRSLSNYAADVLRLHPGASVAVQGRLVASTGAGQTVELKADESGLKCVECHRVYPIRDDIPVMLKDEAIPLDQLK